MSHQPEHVHPSASMFYAIPLQINVLTTLDLSFVHVAYTGLYGTGTRY